MKRILMTMIVMSMLALSCRTARKELQKGHYEKAITKSISKIEKRKDLREHKEVLNEALSKYYSQVQSDLKYNTSIPSKEATFEKLIKLDGYYMNAGPHLNEANKQNMEKTDAITAELKSEIVESMYTRGLSLLTDAKTKKNKAFAQQAHRDLNYLKTKYNPNLPQLEVDLKEAYELALYILTFETDINFNIIERSEVDRIFRGLEQQSGYTISYFNRKVDKTDCFIELDFSNLEEQQSTNSTTRSFEQQVEDGYTVTRDSLGREIRVPKYRTARGQVDIQTTTYRMTWRIAADVNKVTPDCRASDRNFQRSLDRQVERYLTRGDIQAIPSQYRNNNNNRYERDEHLRSLINDLYQEVRSEYTR